MRKQVRMFFTLLLLLSSAFAFAQEVKLEGDKEERARALFSELRCVVCQNQSIDSSDADVAKDLREIVREQITAGQTDTQIKSYLVQRYGEFVLMRPSLAWHTLILWVAPFILLILGALLAWSNISKRRMAPATALTAEEEQRLKDLIEK